jgi:hypothetical protein
MWVQQLFLKTETLDFVEILSSFKWDDIVCTDSCHRNICWVKGCVECQSSFSRNNLKTVNDYKQKKWFHHETKTIHFIARHFIPFVEECFHITQYCLTGLE